MEIKFPRNTRGLLYRCLSKRLLLSYFFFHEQKDSHLSVLGPCLNVLTRGSHQSMLCTACWNVLHLNSQNVETRMSA